MFLSEEQQEAIITAYRKSHTRQVLHINAELHHMLISNDERMRRVISWMTHLLCYRLKGEKVYSEFIRICY
jgi:hypothetical protein